MASVNKVILVGNLGRDPELRYTPGGQAVATFSIATTENYTKKSGEREERTEWHRIVLWGKSAESLQPYLTKGKQVYIEGRLHSRSYEQDGVKKYITEVVAEELILLGGRGESAGAGAEFGGGSVVSMPRSAGGPRPASAAAAPAAEPFPDVASDDDVPF